jgi:hypothetical protein
LLQLSGLEDILSSVLDRREDRARRPATYGRASINLALFPRQSRINNESWNREPDGARANDLYVSTTSRDDICTGVRADIN